MVEYIVKRNSDIRFSNRYTDAYVVQKLIRCKNCKWFHPTEKHPPFGECGKANGPVHEENWFCADGEAKNK